ncbi:MAG: hypothetical protein KAJ09_09890, partial [Deltaproteobacteria bacterium]|nr:hypothetical protein [Deltaproteobacteria bacterium]
MAGWSVITPILLAIFMASSSLGQPKTLSSKVFFSQNSALAGDEIRVALQLDIEKGWHINAHKPLDTSLIATEVVLEPDPNITLRRIQYPRPKRKTFKFIQGEMAV